MIRNISEPAISAVHYWRASLPECSRVRDHQFMMSQPPGPLVVSSTNPRYFTTADAQGKAVYLTGCHVNNNLQDGSGSGRDCPEDPKRFDYDAYLDLLAERAHNFIRLWRWEQFRGYLGPADVHFCMTPQPWPRTGPGSAKDGKPKFDLSAFDQAYFDRLRDRTIAAGAAGIYASVMLFEGFSLHLTDTPDNIEGHPFHGANNINGVGITSIHLITMQPRTELSSTGFALADAGNEYLILQPSEVADPFTVAVVAGRYSVKWYSVRSRETIPGGAFTVPDNTEITMSAPPDIAGPAVVYLRRIPS